MHIVTPILCMFVVSNDSLLGKVVVWAEADNMLWRLLTILIYIFICIYVYIYK